MPKTKRKTIANARRLRKMMTRAEVILWSKLRRKQLGGYRFRRQVPIGPYIADFVCLESKLVIEVDGETHASDKNLRHDAERTEYMNSHGFHVHRVFNIEIYQNLTGVLDGIGQLIHDSAHENPPHQ